MRTNNDSLSINPQENQWHNLVLEIENRLRKFYSVPINSDSVLDFLMDARDLKHSYFDLDLKKKRAATILLENEPEDSLEISWFIDENLKEDLLLNNPLYKLNQNNLDSFSVLTEEISHVLLLMHRASLRQNVSAIELELQAELDKVLFANQLLSEQGTRKHLPVLIRTLFDRVSYSCTTDEIDRYRDANKIAAHFWFRFSEKFENLDTCLTKQPNIKMFFMKIYRAPFAGKISILKKFIDHL